MFADPKTTKDQVYTAFLKASEQFSSYWGAFADRTVGEMVMHNWAKKMKTAFPDVKQVESHGYCSDPARYKRLRSLYR